MLNLHVYEPEELTPRDWEELKRLEFSTDDVSCVVYVTKATTNESEWDGVYPMNPAWRCVSRGHWFVYYHS